ncbi:MAG TPA: TetR/AcrR family transcriptional regulator [Actinophytocola sp.]|uniref:TetR/AcrR family transcriptional regulator n=1 Tax=Actinophytocola sp. TaxID=1872138 RepID=UPI002DDCD97C|nr:TetR/AcrR family transcriptional regulator [Actinophytocola sp.]HEV2778874.1 TetR/AcrR family transcriptional regulator [Actinophytocola sp.]
MGRRPAAETRAHILDTAARLFDAHGVHAVGLQQIIDEFGCGKNLLYREFPSKDDLVVAYLQARTREWEQRVESAIRPLDGDPGAQLVAIVRDAADKATVAGTRGCPLRNAFAEFPDPDHPAHRVAVDHFAAVRARLLEIAEQTGARDPGPLADRIMLIIDGLYANGAILGPNGAAAAAVRFAEDVVNAATHA